MLFNVKYNISLQTNVITKAIKVYSLSPHSSGNGKVSYDIFYKEKHSLQYIIGSYVRILL